MNLGELAGNIIDHVLAVGAPPDDAARKALVEDVARRVAVAMAPVFPPGAGPIEKMSFVIGPAINRAQQLLGPDFAPNVIEMVQGLVVQAADVYSKATAKSGEPRHVRRQQFVALCGAAISKVFELEGPELVLVSSNGMPKGPITPGRARGRG